MPKLADDPQTENAKRQLAEDQKVVDKSRSEYQERMKGRPTPTQEELNIIALGGHILEFDDDGSGPDPHQTKQVEAGTSRPQTYQTRQTKPASS